MNGALISLFEMLRVEKKAVKVKGVVARETDARDAQGRRPAWMESKMF